MLKTRASGIFIFSGAILLLTIYAYMIINPELRIWALVMSVTTLVTVVLGIAAWVGIVMIRTPPPKPLETSSEPPP